MNKFDLDLDSKAKNFPYFIIVVALFFLIISHSFLSDGMFKDGILYAVISKNLANNIGDFWNLSCTKTMLTKFYEHPPLAFAIESIFFKIFGESILIERFYSAITFVFNGIIIVRIWKLVADKKHVSFSWLPLFFLLTIPKVTWAASNNLLENTLQIFTSLSVFFIVKYKYKSNYIWLISSGIMLFLGFLTKGPVALFPLSFLFWIFIFEKHKNITKMVVDSIILFLAAIIPLLLMFIIVPESFDSIFKYLNVQVIESILNTQTVTTRFSVIFGFLKGLIPLGIIILTLNLFTKKSEKSEIKLKWVYPFILLGLSGIFPIMITLKQRGFYILPALPFISIAFSLYFVPKIAIFVEKLNKNDKKYKIFSILSYSLLVLSIFLISSQVGKTGRDKDKISDIKKVIEVVPKESTISIQPQLRTDWALHGYFYRYANISLDDKSYNHKYLLSTKNIDSILSKNYVKVPINLKLYNLFKRE